MVAEPKEVSLGPLSIDRFTAYLNDSRMDEVHQTAESVRESCQGKVIWNINSTAAGGGVAEMLHHLLRYALGANIDVRWLVIEGDQPFFTITKRLHNGLHGSPGDGGLLGKNEEEHYAKISKQNLEVLKQSIKSGDFVILHDPQPAGLVQGLKAHGARVIWRCHIGHDSPNELVQRSWQFLRPFLQDADAFSFTRKTYVPKWVDEDRLVIVPPSIDPFSPKNHDMTKDVVVGIVSHLGVIERPAGKLPPLKFERQNGEEGQIEHHADILHAGPLPTSREPLIIQVSRWDRLKDMVGVMRGFSDYVADKCDAHLALVGPNVHGVTDDPEGADVYNHCVDIWRELPHFRRRRVQLVTLPMLDVEENAAMVNALQRHACIVVQKSLYEGFGLTVTEAMWKGRPVVASNVGGIADQITDGENGLLIKDSTNLEEFGQALCRFLTDATFARKCGKAARKTVLEQFLPPRHLKQYADLLLTFK